MEKSKENFISQVRYAHSSQPSRDRERIKESAYVRLRESACESEISRDREKGREMGVMQEENNGERETEIKTVVCLVFRHI